MGWQKPNEELLYAAYEARMEREREMMALREANGMIKPPLSAEEQLAIKEAERRQRGTVILEKERYITVADAETGESLLLNTKHVVDKAEADRIMLTGSGMDGLMDQAAQLHGNAVRSAALHMLLDIPHHHHTAKLKDQQLRMKLKQREIAGEWFVWRQKVMTRYLHDDLEKKQVAIEWSRVKAEAEIAAKARELGLLNVEKPKNYKTVAAPKGFVRASSMRPNMSPAASKTSPPVSPMASVSSAAGIPGLARSGSLRRIRAPSDAGSVSSVGTASGAGSMSPRTPRAPKLFPAPSLSAAAGAPSTSLALIPAGPLEPLLEIEEDGAASILSTAGAGGDASKAPPRQSKPAPAKAAAGPAPRAKGTLPAITSGPDRSKAAKGAGPASRVGSVRSSGAGNR